jgi:RNA-splicing ligase RtcB
VGYRDGYRDVFGVVGEPPSKLSAKEKAITVQVVNCHHNYTERENHLGRDLWITRKGAIKAGPGDLGVIPGSMGTDTYIVRGKGNPESYNSSSHGAGRRLARRRQAPARQGGPEGADEGEDVERRRRGVPHR